MGNHSSSSVPSRCAGVRSIGMSRQPKMGNGVPTPPVSRWISSKPLRKNYRSPLVLQDQLPHSAAYNGNSNRQSSTPGRIQSTPHSSSTPSKFSPNTPYIPNKCYTNCNTTSLPIKRGTSMPRSPDYPPPHPSQTVYKQSDSGAADVYRRDRSSSKWGQRYVALHDYTARVEDDLSMSKGQQFYIVDRSQGYWWYAKCTATGRTGYVPFNYLAPATSLESNEWHFGNMRRLEAENCLMVPENGHGSFLVRISESRTGEFSLSVRDTDVVKHYRIRSRASKSDPELQRFYISRQLPFPSIQQLVEHYTKSQSGLCCQLLYPCLRPAQPVPVGLSHNMMDKWEIPKSSIVLKERIGKGQFGEVYKAVWNGTTLVAVKTLRANLCNIDEFLMEAHTMKRLHHPHLIQLYAVCTQSAPFYLVAELMSKGSLLKFLQSCDGRALTVRNLILVAVQVASGMAYLESQQFVHRDLAARNCLVGEGNVIKIGDFGLARMIQNQEYVAHAGARFPIKWTAPEAANYSRFTIASDVWSFGILLTEIITYGRVPYPGMHNAEVLRQVEAGYRMPSPPGCPAELYDLMLECWSADETARPSFAGIHGRLEAFCDEWERPAYRDPITPDITTERLDSPPVYRHHQNQMHFRNISPNRI